jgi:hypothetical protein
LADGGEIDQYQHTAYTDLAASFLAAVPAVEPAPVAPWIE